MKEKLDQVCNVFFNVDSIKNDIEAHYIKNQGWIFGINDELGIPGYVKKRD